MSNDMVRIAKRSLFVTATVAACVLLGTVGAFGRQSGLNRSKPQPDKLDVQRDSKDGAIKLNATVINIAAVVTDRSGRYVPQLTKDDFQILEDSAEQQIAFFGNEEVPFNVALLMDVSQSVSDSLKDIKKAATEFVHQLRPNDRVMIACSDERVRYLTDFTSDRKTLETAINGCQTGHGTSVYDAVYDTVTARFRGIEGRKALLLLSDGEDTTSQRVTYDQTIDRVAESDVLVYGLRYPDTGGHGGWGNRPNRPFPGRRWPLAAAGLVSPDPLGQFPGGGQYPGQYPPGGQYPRGGGRGQRGPYGGRRKDSGRDFMKDVTEAGGGPLYDAKTSGDLRKLAPQIADELRHVYVIGYYPTKSLSEGGYRTLKVKVKGRDELAVRHRRGYDAHQTAAQPAS
jgi:VWFA-related protein